MRVMTEAQQAARELMARDPELTDPMHAALRARIHELFELKADSLN